mmetsp:Transcript_12833/g.23998  ORF Transcript_12833/g.23998 Transcript_12833/m.23998 type:complete len:92 (-) Transcript_12833:184-459(-)
MTPPNTGLILALPFLIKILYKAYAMAQAKAGKIHTAKGGDATDDAKSSVDDPVDNIRDGSTKDCVCGLAISSGLDSVLMVATAGGAETYCS